jgi:hypothetical protein
MNLPIQFTMQDIQQMAQGSPAIVDMAGRAFGLAEEERKDLVSGKLPLWFWVTLGVVGGVLVGVQWHKRAPGSVPRLLGGG